ncbi:UvrD-helicase domain-containing protein [Candidatus Kaiserbacteria bacterium]|nr:UvrD-helicase domain-containing protein [Candidatus Kaiserbacteria bacterium]
MHTEESRYLQGLNPQQKEAVLCTEGPVLIVAGAGAGKTKTITHRIAHMIEQGIPARSILAVTFTNKAAGEMRDRVRNLIPEGHGTPLVATFHSLGVRLLREFHKEAGLERGFSIWDRDDSMRVVKKALEKLDIENIPPRQVLSIISREKGDGMTVARYESGANSFKERTVAQVWRIYDKALHEEGALDFDDLLGRTLRLLQESPSTLSLLQNRWKYITIDEYQDTNAAQYEIARLLAGDRRNLCVVGDTDQNIYSWRGADIEHLMSFEKTFPGTKVILLEQNYRSTRTILTAANAVIAKNKRRKEKNLFTDNDTGEPLMAYGARNEIDESWFVAQTAVTLIEEGINPAEIAILYRENFQSRALEEALLAFSVPYRVLGTKFFERKEVKDTLSYLRAALNPRSKDDLARIVGVPARGIGKVTLDKLFDTTDMPVDTEPGMWSHLALHSLAGSARVKVQTFLDTIQKIRHAIDTLPTSEAVRYCVEASGMEAMYKNDKEEGYERLENIRELVNLAVRYDDVPPPEGIERLLEEAALQSDQDELTPSFAKASQGKEVQKAVSLMTIHASKGLEFDAVFITGMEQGLFPSLREDTRDPEEERRLFYVAVTRARKRLFLSYAGERMKYGSRERALASEFIHDIDSRLMVHTSRDDDSDRSERTVWL